MKVQKPKVPKNASDAEQSARFIEAAQHQETGDKEFERAFKKAVPPRGAPAKPKR